MKAIPAYILTDWEGRFRELAERPADWDAEHEAFKAASGCQGYGTAFSLDRHSVTPQGIPWHEELAGRDGMSYALFIRGEAREAIEAAKAWLRERFDVVRILVIHCKLAV